jgi:DNA repair protein RadA/Sms
MGRCPTCDAWGTLVEEVTAARTPASVSAAATSGSPPVPIAEVAIDATERCSTGVEELDRVLGGGLVPGSVTLLAGEPGMGKSTLLLQALGAMASAGLRCLLVTAEESPAQVRMRAERVGALAGNLLVAGATDLHHVIAHAEAVAPDVLAIDSIQTVVDPDRPGAPGSVTQVRDCAYRLVQLAKERGIATLLVGHVTKEGTVAGPRVLEHIVDTVLSFDGDRGHSLRLLRALKHRFGSTQELGLFDMTSEGLECVPDASARFLVDRRPGVAGSAVAAVLEGARPVMVEVQALVVASNAPSPRRSGSGIDAQRLSMLLAVLAQRAKVDMMQHDVYGSIAGGLRVTEPGLDLALALAAAGARTGRAAPERMVVVGELGLGGEVRSVPQLERRLAEAARLGFETALVPPGTPEQPGIQVLPVGDLREAVALGLIRADPGFAAVP